MDSQDRIDFSWDKAEALSHIEAHLELMKDELDELYNSIYSLPNSIQRNYILNKIIKIIDLFPMFA
jgi:DNA-directed RNA polymerase subunit F